MAVPAKRVSWFLNSEAIMAKKPSVVSEHFTVPQSLEDAGFQWGRNSAQQGSITQYIMDQVPGLGDPAIDEQLPKDQKEKLRVGLRNHYAENLRPSRHFVVVDNNLVETPEEKWNEFNGEKRKLDIFIACAMDQSTLTHLRENEKAWYGLIQEVKTDFNQYFSNACREIVSKAKKLYAKKHGIKRERSLTKVFSIREKEVMEDLLQKCITANSRGNDESADIALTKKRIAAYFAVTK